MEMGTHINGFHGWIAKASTKSRFNIGYCGSTYQDGAFIAYNMTFSVEHLSHLYIQHIIRLHGVLVTIVLDQDSRFTVEFWRSLQTALGTSLNLSLAFHSQWTARWSKLIK